jgi:hypothetical protein
MIIKIQSIGPSSPFSNLHLHKHYSAKRYERLLKAHGITIATPRKGAAAVNNDGGDGDTPASRKRKRATAAAAKRENGANNRDSSEEGAVTPVKRGRRAAVKKERVIKKEESVDDDEDVVKTENVEDPEETEGSFHPRRCRRSSFGYRDVLSMMATVLTSVFLHRGVHLRVSPHLRTEV